MASEARVNIAMPASTGGLASTTRVPRDVRAEARKRLGWVALLLAMIFIGISLLSLIVQFAGGDEELALGDVIVGVLSLALFATARARAIPDKIAFYAGLAFFVITVTMIHFGNIGSVWSEHGHLPGITFGSILIVALPLIVPTSPRRTVLAVAIAAATAPLAVFVLQQRVGVAMGFEQYLHVTVVPVLAAVIAVFGSRMVHGISVEVAKARELGSYRLQTKIGSGGMGEVWKAEHSMLARPAAVKLIRATEGGVSETSVKRFEREAQVTAQLHSPHTVDLYDFGIANDGTIYYVMELLDGVDLDQLVREHGAQPAERVVHILDQMCHSLQEAHAAGLVHRDVKPANTFVCRYGEDYDFVKVLDFGLVALKPQTDAPKSEALTVDNVVQGSPAFMSPEAITAPKEVGPASDLYAVGCIAYWLLTGRDVFESEGVVARMADHIHSKPEPLSASGVEVPSELESLVMDCLAKDPADRPSSAAEVAERLHASVFSEPWNQERARLWWKAHAA